MKTWGEVQTFIDKHNLAFKVERYNMSLRGTLVCEHRNEVIAYTVKTAAAYLRSLAF